MKSDIVLRIEKALKEYTPSKIEGADQRDRKTNQ